MTREWNCLGVDSRGTGRSGIRLAYIDKARFISKSSILNIITCSLSGKPTSKLKQILKPLRDGVGRWRLGWGPGYSDKESAEMWVNPKDMHSRDRWQTQKILIAVISLREQKNSSKEVVNINIHHQHTTYIYMYMIRNPQTATHPCTWSLQGVLGMHLHAHISTWVLDMSLDAFECMDMTASLK